MGIRGCSELSKMIVLKQLTPDSLLYKNGEKGSCIMGLLNRITGVYWKSSNTLSQV